MKTKVRNVTLGAMLVILLTASIGHADLSDGLVAYYPFNGNTADETGNYAPLTVYGATPTNDRVGNPNSAYSLDGIDDWMAGASYDVINPSALSSFAVSFWFSPASTWTTGDNPNTMLVGNIVNDPPYYNPRGWFDWGVMISSSLAYDGSLYFWWIDDTYHVTRELNTTTTTWNAGEWYHVLYDYDVSTETLSAWVNGRFESSMTVTTDIGRDNGGNILAVANYNASYADMSIDEVRIYNRALTASEVHDLYVIPAPGAFLLGALGLSVAGWKLRRRKK